MFTASLKAWPSYYNKTIERMGPDFYLLSSQIRPIRNAHNTVIKVMMLLRVKLLTCCGFNKSN